MPIKFRNQLLQSGQTKVGRALAACPIPSWGVIIMARNKLVVPGSENALNQMKEEIASEFGVQLGADTTARANGSVGGEMTKRLVALGEQAMRNRQGQ
jgi:hypothetical protein